ncbi:hypothetical protein N7532_007118 [Penicillium argentinense]|uniref:Uncharacterized protein n=1 Tax=Penicillium argentinense TaxID=1131581 RepID=A0A9W9FHK6_9EURO|nr:uncharacterized protein N7532_007118 [Penicillium argentinense]KAJ5100117.1 hypothetical protein N7532_007118 [Penicillium argentinense]
MVLAPAIQAFQSDQGNCVEPAPSTKSTWGQDLNAPQNASIPTPHDAMHVAKKKMQPISCIIQCDAFEANGRLHCTGRDASPWRDLHTHTGRVSRPRGTSWPQHVQGGAVPAVGWCVFHETELIVMLLGELSGTERRGDCHLKLRVEQENLAPVLFETVSRLEGTRWLVPFLSANSGRWTTREDATPSWRGPACSPAARRWSYRPAKDSLPLRIPRKCPAMALPPWTPPGPAGNRRTSPDFVIVGPNPIWEVID